MIISNSFQFKMAIDFTQVTSDKSFVSFSNEFRKNDYLIVELPDDIQKDLNNGEKYALFFHFTVR